MKKSIYLLLLLFSAQSKAENVKSFSSSDISAVKIFLSGAQVIRTAKVSIEKGETEVALENLSSQIDPQSIIVTGTGDALIKGVNFTIDYLKDKKKSPELQRLQDSITVLQLNMDKLNVNISVLNDELSLLASNKNVGGSNTGVSADNLMKVADFFRKRSTELKTELIDYNSNKLKLTEKILKINNQIDELNGRLNQPFGTIIVTLNADQKTLVNLSFSYFVPSASWTPFYELHGKGVKDNVELIYKASVQQTSGENWNNVSLTLSTGNPQLSNTKPSINPWFIDFYLQRQNLGSMRENSGPAPAAYETMTVQGAKKDDQLKTVDVEMSENAVSNDFEIKQTYSIQSGGKDVTVTIDKHNLPAIFNYYVAPKIDKTAFLIASITGWEQLSLLPGEANIYFENSYVGKSYINPASTEDTLKLSMGRDPRIVVKREKIQDLSSVKFIGANITKKFVYDISIRNTRTESISLLIEDQIPLTKNESIKISMDELSGGTLNVETGKIQWNLDIKPNENKKIRIGYSVKYPKEKTISGL